MGRAAKGAGPWKRVSYDVSQPRLVNASAWG